MIIDELHYYTGVFGSHMGNIIRRLKRICSFYGSDPVFIMSSATIANPGELAEMVDVLRTRLHIEARSLPLALAGSLLLRGAGLKDELLRRLNTVGVISPVVSEVAEPVCGAVRLARAALQPKK